VPGVPRDPEDHEGDPEADQRVCDFQAECNDGRTGEDAKADESVYAGMAAVRNEGGTVEPVSRARPYLSGDLVADEPEAACSCEPPKVRQVTGTDETLDRLKESDARGHEDGQDNEEARVTLSASTPQEKGDAERHGGKRVAEVVNEVGE
jgi:hypothetical protein